MIETLNTGESSNLTCSRLRGMMDEEHLVSLNNSDHL